MFLLADQQLFIARDLHLLRFEITGFLFPDQQTPHFLRILFTRHSSTASPGAARCPVLIVCPLIGGTVEVYSINYIADVMRQHLHSVFFSLRGNMPMLTLGLDFINVC